ncbi:hypothetical protein AGMMS49949_06210 [Alphaproteobacteria bacterium]|nr:hypothetical protein AGMMS49949_06210 [Alphaproteobacteria bacterium]GHS98189.1 hypothetical protein AGMMS50296_5710 [Alphaproteobacteria bacterium]
MEKQRVFDFGAYTSVRIDLQKLQKNSSYVSNPYNDIVIKFLITSNHGGVATIPWDFYV